jgi:hypothetical protein
MTAPIGASTASSVPPMNCGVTMNVLTVNENEKLAPLNCAVYWYVPGAKEDVLRSPTLLHPRAGQVNDPDVTRVALGCDVRIQLPTPAHAVETLDVMRAPKEYVPLGFTQVIGQGAGSPLLGVA